MTSEPVAVVGMACRFAGAPDLHAYWEQARTGRSAFGPVPRDRWDSAAFAADDRRAPDRSYTRTGAFLDDVATFPALALGIPPRRAEVMDPQQRLILELCLQAIEDAGLPEDGLPPRTGVFMGVTSSEYRLLLAARVVARLMALGALGSAPSDPEQVMRAVSAVVPPRPFTATGALGNMVAASAAHHLGLQGAAFTVDAACASSLVAVDDAVRRLRTGELDAALVGGVYLCLTPEHHIAFSRLGAISPSGVCRPFDRRGDGFVEGEGAGVVLLKRISDAERDGDRIDAVIEGTAVNADGRTDGVMTPSAAGQAAVIRAAWEAAGLDPAELGYVETHGTATVVGDAAEAQGLVDALGTWATTVPIGSSKANIGHTMSAAGIAGLIRAARAVATGIAPPMAGWSEPRPGAAHGLTVPTEAVPFREGARLAAVSSFGFGGTNSSAVLRAPERRPAERPGTHLVLLSAPHESALRVLAGRVADAVADDPRMTVVSVARALAVRRRQPARLGVVASERDELVAALRCAAAGSRHPALHLAVVPEGPPPRIAFLYPGQGAQEVGMGRALGARFPPYRAALTRLERALQGETTGPLTTLLFPEFRSPRGDAAAAQAELTATENCQPALVAVGTATTELLGAAGVAPHVVAGHSVGEFTAAVTAGVLRAEDAVRFAARRGRAMAALGGDRGAMAALFASGREAERLLVPGAVVANLNHRRQVVVSGTSDAVRSVVAAAGRAGIRATPLAVSHAFHSPVMAGADLSALVAELPLADPGIAFASGILDRPITRGADARESFARHATAPVDFLRALGQVVDAGCDIAVQASPGGPVAAMARAALTCPVVDIGPSLDDDGRSLLLALARLWVAGAPVDPRPLLPAAPPASLPPSPLPRERYWAVRPDADFPLDRDARAPVAPPSEPQETTPVVAAAAPVRVDQQPAAVPERDARDVVLATLALVSSYPVETFGDDVALVDDLGFDSLMVVSFIEELSKAVPLSVPDEALVRARTVGDVIALLGGPAGPRGPGPRPSRPRTGALPARARRDPAGWPEVRELADRRAAAASAGLDDPYFRVHEGPSGPHATVDGRELLAFTSYDYLGLSADPRVVADVAEAVRRYGTSVSASRLASGERPFHGELERELARAQGAEAALAFTSGHATNMGVIGALACPGDLVVHDQLAHDSVLQGIRLSGAERVGFRHNDLDHLDRLLRELRPRAERCLVVVEGVYSADGDVCPLAGLVELKNRHECLLMVDEAHSFGVLGTRGLGIGEHAGVDGAAVDVWMGTLSKSLASCGGWVAGSETMIDWLRYSTPGFVFSAGLTPANTQAALSALRLLRAEPDRIARLRRNAALFHGLLRAQGVPTGTCRGESGVVPVITGSSASALALAQRLLAEGIDVQPMLFPAVAEDGARLRFFLSQGHTEAELRWAAGLVGERARAA